MVQEALKLICVEGYQPTRPLSLPRACHALATALTAGLIVGRPDGSLLRAAPTTVFAVSPHVCRKGERLTALAALLVSAKSIG